MDIRLATLALLLLAGSGAWAGELRLVSIGTVVATAGGDLSGSYPAPAVYQAANNFTGKANITSLSSMTVLGTAFSVGVSTFNISSGNVGVSSTTPTALFAVGTSTFNVTVPGFVNIGSITISGVTAPPTTMALCLSATGQLGHCTSVVGALGNCTCAAP